MPVAPRSRPTVDAHRRKPLRSGGAVPARGRTAALGSCPLTCSTIQPGRTPPRSAGPAAITRVTTGSPSMGVTSSPTSPVASAVTALSAAGGGAAPAGRMSKCERPRRASISRSTPRTSSSLRAAAARGRNSSRSAVQSASDFASSTNESRIACHAASKVAAPFTPRPMMPVAGDGACSRPAARYRIRAAATRRHRQRAAHSTQLRRSARGAGDRAEASSGSAEAQEH